jgi:DNA-nicking Smr family endonuclease
VKKKQRGRDGGNNLDPGGDEDHALWRHAAQTVEPLRHGKGRFHPASDAVKSGAQRAKPAPTPDKSSKHRTAVALPEPVTAARKTTTTPPELANFDRTSARKIRGGRLEIEARVDLHGMRQHEAHAALRRFLLSCQRRGFRYVLIITGKGKALGSVASHIGEADRDRGVLKRNVPRWLEEPDMRALVVSYTTAAIQHGGEGAIYVHLRSNRRGEA